jgi:hypothetical protein
MVLLEILCLHIVMWIRAWSDPELFGHEDPDPELFDHEDPNPELLDHENPDPVLLFWAMRIRI